MYEYRKLRGRIVEKFGSASKFSAKLGSSKAVVSNHLTGKSGFSQHDIVAWAKLLDIDKQDFGAYFFN